MYNPLHSFLTTTYLPLFFSTSLKIFYDLFDFHSKFWSDFYDFVLLSGSLLQCTKQKCLIVVNNRLILLTGTQQESRLEFSTPRGKYKKNFDFRFEFRTKETEGILLYVSNRAHEQYVAVYLLEGHVSQ